MPTDAGTPVQSSEAKVGPYALQDFSLYHVLRYGFRPSKVAFLAWHAWHDATRGDWPAGFPEDARRAYSLKEIRHWLQVFSQRFYSFSQFKRSALPNGPKVLAGGAETEMQPTLKRAFTKVANVKPPASRSDSSEKFVVAMGFRGREATGGS